MSRVRIIGIGSPAGDDQAGWITVEALHESGALDDTTHEISTVMLDRPGAQLVQHLEGADVVILIDAVQGNDSPGTIHRIDLAALIKNNTNVSSHDIGVAEALALANALHALPSTLIIFGIEAASTLPNTEPGPATTETATKLATEIVSMIHAM